jgi:hypothetical protein
VSTSPDTRIEVAPDGSVDLFLGAERVYSACLPVGMSKQQGEKRVDQGLGFGRGRLNDDSLALGKAPLQRLCDTGQLFDLNSKILTQRLLEWPVLALLLIALSWVLLGHGAKRSCNGWGAAA